MIRRPYRLDADRRSRSCGSGAWFATLRVWVHQALFLLLFGVIGSVATAASAQDRLIISGGTIVDAVHERLITNKVIIIEAGRFKAIIDQVPPGLPGKRVDASNKFIIPGMMDGNVHLLLDGRLENLVRHEDRFPALIEEAAQIALKNGVTTVFDSWGPLDELILVRDRIRQNKVIGARMYVAGNILGFDGPLSPDFWENSTKAVSKSLAARINRRWTQNVGPELLWMTPEQVRAEVRRYIAKGVDFIKYGASGHTMTTMPFLAFSPDVQRVIVEEAQAAGRPVQTHTSTVESVRIAANIGVNAMQHCELTGPVPLPASLIETMRQKQIYCGALPSTQARIKTFGAGSKGTEFEGLDKSLLVGRQNIASLVAAKAKLMLATDAGVFGADISSDPLVGARFIDRAGDLTEIGEGHFRWLQAMEEFGLDPFEMLRAATINVAAAYKKEKVLGSIATGKIADLVILDENPLTAAKNYRTISLVIKDGNIIDTGRLPMQPILTATSAR
jgi:imidazolonepropionase-like amidohydrolase